jgi:hypothetical protein
MSDDDIKRLRELAENVIRCAEQRQKAADDPAIDWIEYDHIAQEAVDQQEALVERVGARTLLALLSRLEAAERERDALAAQRDRMVDILVGIHALLNPPAITERGKQWVFSHNAVGRMQALSDRIRAIPDEIDALAAKEQTR